MPDQFTKVTTKGLGQRTANSVGAALMGVVMFFGSFGLLYWNEGRTDLSSVAVNAVRLDPQTVSSEAEGQLVSVTGEVASDAAIGDDLFLAEGSYLLVERNVEMYAWVEETEEETSTNVGGSETTTTTYNYVKEWTANPKQESEFEYPEGHENPELTIESDAWTVNEFKVGEYAVDGGVDMPAASDLSLTEEIVSLSSGADLANSSYIFLGNGTLANPQLGDVRVSYTVLEPGFTGTVMGELQDGTIKNYTDVEGNSIWRLFTGSHDEAIATLHNEFVVMTWILRLVGFFLMWFGLMSVFGPLATLLDILPVFGSTTRFLVGLVTFPIALVLSAVTIIVSMILHNLIAVIIAVLVVAGLVIWYFKNKRAKMSAAPMRK